MDLLLLHVLQPHHRQFSEFDELRFKVQAKYDIYIVTQAQISWQISINYGNKQACISKICTHTHTQHTHTHNIHTHIYKYVYIYLRKKFSVGTSSNNFEFCCT